MPAVLLLFLRKPIVWVGIALLLSLAANWGLWKLHSHDLTRMGALEEANKQDMAEIKACSDATAELRRQGDAATARARAAEIVAGAARRALEQRAQATLQEKPAVPGDACASALELNRRKLGERRGTPR